jgi:hypothetical protein
MSGTDYFVTWMGAMKAQCTSAECDATQVPLLQKYFQALFDITVLSARNPRSRVADGDEPYSAPVVLIAFLDDHRRR